jgi:hypothetical protein
VLEGSRCKRNCGGIGLWAENRSFLSGSNPNQRLRLDRFYLLTNQRNFGFLAEMILKQSFMQKFMRELSKADIACGRAGKKFSHSIV